MELVNHIEVLLEKYLEANTTLAEEQELRNYFMQDNVAPHLQEYQYMFNYFSVTKEEKFTQNVPLNTRKKPYLKWISVAAVALFIFGTYQGKQRYDQYQAEIAYQQTQEAFELLAKNFGKGTQSFAYLGEFEKSKQKILK